MIGSQSGSDTGHHPGSAMPVMSTIMTIIGARSGALDTKKQIQKG